MHHSHTLRSSQIEKLLLKYRMNIWEFKFVTHTSFLCKTKTTTTSLLGIVLNCLLYVPVLGGVVVTCKSHIQVTVHKVTIIEQAQHISTQIPLYLCVDSKLPMMEHIMVLSSILWIVRCILNRGKLINLKLDRTQSLRNFVYFQL